MASKLDELDKLNRAIADAEIRLKSIQSAVENIDKEIAVLSPRKMELEQSIEFRKQSNAIPIAQEYKKTKSELSKVTARLILISADQKKAIQACKDIEQIIEKFKKDQYELIKTSDDNVLQLFGAKRGKK